MTDSSMHDDLLRFWDDLVDGKPATPGALDPSLANVIRRLHGERNDAQPDPDYATRLRADLMHQTGYTELAPLAAVPDNGQAVNGRMQPRIIPMPAAPDSAHRRRDKHWHGWLAAAVLVVLALGAGYLIVVPAIHRSPHRTTLPAAAPATPTPLPTVEFTIPAADLPTHDIGMGITRNTIEPGNRSTWHPYCCPGPMLEYVLEGSYTVRAEAAITVVRATGISQTVPAGTEVTLGPGDYLISDNETVVEASNTGTHTVQLLNWTLIEDTGNAFSGHLLLGWTNNDPDVQGAVSLSNGPATVRLRRVVLSPGESLPAPPDGVYQFHIPLPVNAAGTPVAKTLESKDGSLRNWGTETLTVYVLEFEPAHVSATPPVTGSPMP